MCEILFTLDLDIQQTLKLYYVTASILFSEV